MSDKIDILGSQISVWNLEETVEKIAELARSEGKHYVCVSNVHTVVTGMQDPSYAEITNKATLATADGVPLIWASRVLAGPNQPCIHGRASGPDVMAKLFDSEVAQGIKHYFYGSTPEVLRDFKTNLAKRVPSLQCAGFLAPPFRKPKAPSEPLDESELEDVEAINASGADIVWVGLGAPKQEIWMYRARKHLKPAVLVGVGAAFDFLAGNKKRAPLWMQKTGLEWSYRLMQEPKRLASRYFKTNPVFVASVAKEALKLRLSGKQ